MQDSVIEIEGLKKSFRIYNKPKDLFREVFSPTRKKYHHYFTALQDINFSVKKGEMLGIVGVNGSGKSTLLQLIAGVMTPTTGKVKVHGTISALLELGAGFNPELSGEENVRFQCALMEIPKDAQADLMHKIFNFADIGDFVSRKVKTYSSGMYVRLAFATAIYVDPDILIIDEALAVGDARFQIKCLKRIKELKDAGKTILLVSHDASAIRSMCDRAVLLHKSKLIRVGDPVDIINLYNNMIATDGAPATEAETNELVSRGGNKKVEITSIKLHNGNGQSKNQFLSREPLVIEMQLKANQDIEDYTVGIAIQNRFGLDIFGVNTDGLKVFPPPLKQGQKVAIAFEIQQELGHETYSVTVACHRGATHVEDSYDWINNAASFKIIQLGDQRFSGVVSLPTAVKISDLMN